MKKFRVYIWKKIETSGYIDIEADTAEEAFWLAEDLDGWTLERDGVWDGGCGDIDEYGVSDYVEEVYEPTVSEGLWR